MASYPSPAGLWQFNDANHLTQGTKGDSLIEVGTHSFVAGINSGDGAILDPLGSYYICNHGILPNGGGEYVNEWTALMDVKVPASSFGHWVALFQTNVSNSNDADCFIAYDGTIGVADTGYSSSAVSSETWYRIVVSVDNGSFYRIYVDGTLWKEGTIQPVDGRFSLDPQILFFADDDGEDYPIICTNLAVWGQALTSAQVSELGTASNPITFNDAGINMLTNPSGENELTDWTVADGNDWQATDRTDWHWPHTGNYYFTSGRSAHGELSQEIIIPSYLATLIDSGYVVGNTSGYIGGGFDGDQGRILVEYLDDSNAVLATADSGWISGPNTANWTQFTNSITIPVGTRSVQYSLLTQRADGTDCDAFFDDLVWEFEIALPGNNAPSIPTVYCPSTSGGLVIPLSFRFTSTDPESDQVSYQVDWGNEISSWSAVKNSGAGYLTTHLWVAQGTYMVKARSRDVNGAVGDWSSTTAVTITGNPAGVFNSQPYLQNISQNAITIAWETDRVVIPTVDWGLTASYGNNTKGLCINAGLNGSTPVYTCKVRISGLAPQTTYHFRANNGSTLGSDATFKTAPYEQTPFVFGVAGDSQMVARRLINDTPHPECSTAMFTDMASMTDIAVSIGDVVDDASYGLYVSAFRPYMCNILGKQKPVFIAFGNHDEPSTSLVHKVVQNSGMHSFSFNYGNAHFTCIDYSDTVAIKDTMTPDSGAGINSLPLGWIEQDLSSDEAQNATWRFFFIHVPPYSERWFDGSSLMQTYLVPLLNQYDVQACFSGHVHEYERGFLNGTFYVITGCMNYLDIIEPITIDWSFMTVGGAQNIPGVTDGGGEIHGWTEVQINGTELHLIQHAYNLDGSSFGVIDTIDFVQADFNRDKTVDFEDLAILFDSWLSTPQDAGWNPACDMADRAQKIINFKDMAEFAKYWRFNGQF
jgi:Icc-related predicted phosphoesterase